MLHKIIGVLGLGILGIDPFTAIYLLSMGLRKEKKKKISLFFLTFAILSVLIGAILSAIFGAAAVDILKKYTPGDESPFWACLNFAISALISVWVFRKIFAAPQEKHKNEKEISGNWIKYLTVGIVFALTCFTDPTYYAVILLGGESHNFFIAAMFLTVWFAVSQFMALIVYLAIELNLLKKLTEIIDQLKTKNWKVLSYVLYGVLIIVAIALLVDTGYYLIFGKYLL